MGWTGNSWLKEEEEGGPIDQVLELVYRTRSVRRRKNVKGKCKSKKKAAVVEEDPFVVGGTHWTEHPPGLTEAEMVWQSYISPMGQCLYLRSMQGQ